MEKSDKTAITEGESAIVAAMEITCRNCNESFSVPEEAFSQKAFPCPKCSFLNQAEKPGTFSRANILAKLGHIVGNEAEVDEHAAYKARIKGGLALILVIMLTLVYIYFTGH
jgi:hypothetical protein